MEYPGTKFTRVWRRLLLTIFILAFFIISPVVIIYSLGYRYELGDGFLKQTGAISIDVEPKKIAVFLDDNKLKENSVPVKLKNVVPKKYSLKITAPGYFDFIKEIEVKRKQTVYIKEVDLIKQSEPEILINQSVNNFNLSSDYKYIIYSKEQNKQLEIWIWNKKSNESTLLLKKTDIKPVQITWATKNNCAAITNLFPPYDYATVICADKQQTFDLTKIVTSTIEKIIWRDSTSPELYFSTVKDIFSFYPTTQQLRKIDNNNYLDWYIDNGQLWVLQINTSSQQYEIIKDKLGFSDKINNFTTPNINTSSLKLITVKNDHALLKNKNKSEMILVRKDKNFNITGENFLISNYNDWWLFWTPWELWAYTEGENPDLKTRSGENLQTVLSLDKYNALALIWENKTTIFIPYYLVTHDLINEKIKQASADSENKILYYTLKDKQGLWMLEY